MSRAKGIPEKLAPKQAKFVEEYLLDLNATQAAIRAKYSPRTAYRTGCDLLHTPKVAQAIQQAMAERSERTEISQDRVLKEYAKLAFLDPRRFYNERGELIPIHELPEEVAAAIAGMDVATERNGQDADGKPEFVTVRKIKIADKKGALDSVARHLGMFNDKVAVTGKDGQPVQVETSLNPAAMDVLKRILGDDQD